MVYFHATFRVGVAALLLLLGTATGAVSQELGDEGITSLGSGRGLVELTGAVVCVSCSLADARKTHPQQSNLYQLTHKSGQVVMAIEKVNNFPAWNDLTSPPHLQVRGDEALFQQLAAPENQTKQITLSGFLRATRAFDLSNVTLIN